MFREIVLFEIRYRVRRPAIYLYFLALLAFSIFAFSTGSLPVDEKEHINSPYLISFWYCALTMLMSLASSSIMGTAIFRDIEYQTRDYYLTYPITKPGYFWGRFFGAFIFMLLIALAIPLGIWMGTWIGPMIGKTFPAEYGPNKIYYYLYPFLTLGLPNLFFTSALFYGLVAVLRNVKVIYFGGLLLFLCYFISLFFLDHTNNASLTGITDPFAVSWIRSQMFTSNYLQQNGSVIAAKGPLLINRLLWSGLGLAIVLITYWRFNFETFFAGRRDKAMPDETGVRSGGVLPAPAVSFTGNYNRKVLGSLVRLELLNIIKDNYFWVIIGAGSLFLGFAFWMGDSNGEVTDFPRTVRLLSIFADAFPFFIFFVILFYAGETLQRDRLTRYAFINDSLPPPNWVLNGSRLIPLLMLSVGLSVLPVLVGVLVQLLKGFTHFKWELYGIYWLLVILPKFLTGAVFCYVILVMVNNKFAGYAIVVPIWIGMFFLNSTGIFNYRLLLYSYTPNTGISDMDGMGHMVGPIAWYDLYWLLGAGLLIVLAALLYFRGVNTTMKERLQLIPERFNGATKMITAILLFLWLATGAYIYYNVSYKNEWLTQDEDQNRAILYEKSLKKYQSLPLPVVTNMVSRVELYPSERRAMTHAWVTLCNQTDTVITQMLLDADGLADYSISDAGQPLPFTSPLMYKRGMFSTFRPAHDSSDFRLYRLLRPLKSGDSVVLEVRSLIQHEGFENGLYAANMLNNGTIFNGGMPGLGYDEDDELSSGYVRQKVGLPPKEEKDIPQDDPVAINQLVDGAHLHRRDITIGVPIGETAVSQGDLVGQWTENGRSYFHYVAGGRGMYPPAPILAARYQIKRDSVLLDHKIAIEIYYNPDQGNNLSHYMAAFKDGLRYYSSAYGPYPWHYYRQVEGSPYGPYEAPSSSAMVYSENNGWNAHFTDSAQTDFLYIDAARELAHQWWRFQVLPNNTVGDMVIPEGLPTYDAFVLAEKK